MIPEIVRTIALEGEINDSAYRWLVRGFTAWYRDGCAPDRLLACLRIETGSRAATHERNLWLRRAADELAEPNAAADLHRRIKAFMRYEWREWRGSQAPPDDAPAWQQALFFAAAAGAVMTIGRRQLSDILRE